MSEFDRIIGYEKVKNELMQICDMLKNPELYAKLGAKMSHGLLIDGEPGLGKSLMAKCLMKECGRNSYIIRRNKPNGDFIDELREVFATAAENAPSVILLDDMDKFAAEERNDEEYIAVQACIDEVKEKSVYVIATANDLYNIPDSLIRSGRFDRKITVKAPEGDEAIKIIEHYLSTKIIADDLNIIDISKMLKGCSCADLETVINEAAILAVYERCDKIHMRHIVESVMRNNYCVEKITSNIDSEKLERIACHEAGHTVAYELMHKGGIGLACINYGGDGRRGFVIRYSDCTGEENIMMSLAGRAAVDLIYGENDEGAASDLERAIRSINARVCDKGMNGLRLLEINHVRGAKSESQMSQQEGVIYAEVERYYEQTKKLLAANKGFLIAVTNALIKKNLLLSSDIEKIREKKVQG
jgi:cell division protease FtsH